VSDESKPGALSNFVGLTNASTSIVYARSLSIYISAAASDELRPEVLSDPFGLTNANSFVVCARSLGADDLPLFPYRRGSLWWPTVTRFPFNISSFSERAVAFVFATGSSWALKPGGGSGGSDGLCHARRCARWSYDCIGGGMRRLAKKEPWMALSMLQWR
jgi:hypothetical protein